MIFYLSFKEHLFIQVTLSIFIVAGVGVIILAFYSTKRTLRRSTRLVKKTIKLLKGLKGLKLKNLKDSYYFVVNYPIA